MRTAPASLIFLMLTACWQPVAFAADGPPALAHNPFSRPASNIPDDEVSVIENTDGSGPSLALRATMVSTSVRFANVAGRILKLGEEIDGYRLTAVREDSAVFERGGKLITVYVKPNLAENDE